MAGQKELVEENDCKERKKGEKPRGELGRT